MYEDFIEYLKGHPRAEGRDIIKFCYQSAMGPGHMAPERTVAEKRLRLELAEAGKRGAGQPEVTPLESLGARVDVDCGISPESLAALFCLTAERWPAKDPRLITQMATAPEALPYLPVSQSELHKAIGEWQEAGCPAVSHTEGYKRAYRAHYRVIFKQFLPYFEAVAAIEKLKRPAVVTIDGMCGSGKSTLAGVLADIFNAPVVHMDDFFLPFEMKTPDRMAEPGGNVHYERFDAEVAAEIRSGRGLEYGVYDCSVGAITGAKRLEASPLVIVEGSYCLNPHIRDIFDLKLFVETDRETQLERLTAREGENVESFKERWIPLENEYFSRLKVKEKCDIIVRT